MCCGLWSAHGQRGQLGEHMVVQGLGLGAPLCCALSQQRDSQKLPRAPGDTQTPPGFFVILSHGHEGSRLRAEAAWGGRA